MSCIRLALLGAAGLAAASAAQSGAVSRPWWPQPYSVRRADAQGTLTLATPYFVVEHDLKKGGAISKISLTYRRSKNLLVRPLETTLQLATPQGEQTQQAASRLRFSDLQDGAPAVVHEQRDGREVVTVTAMLRNADGGSSGVTAVTAYHYGWGYIRIHKELRFSQPTRTRNFCVLKTILDPSLTDYGYRPNVHEMMMADPLEWEAGMIRHWGKLRAGTNLDLAIQMRHLPKYMVFVNPGVEGLEWFASDNLRQWDYQMTSVPGTGWARAETSSDPLGVAVSLYPMMISNVYEIPGGGAVTLNGAYAFDYYIAFPVREAHANRAWLNRPYAANRGQWASEQAIADNAARGVVTMHLHNDGDHNRDGLFWRDGSYPPYPPDEMKKMDATIAAIHKNGMLTMPYFSNHELHPSTPEFQQHGIEWARILGDPNVLKRTFYYGASMCLRSGWRDYLKLCVDRVLSNHRFDGVYYDWNLAMFCNNPRHTDGGPGGNPTGASLGPEASHWDIDELIDFMEWTRRRVGAEGTVILHNTLAPMFATENFANYVLGLEFSYGKLLSSVPKPADLPPEWNFAGARSRGVIAYGTIGRQAPRRMHRALAVLAAVTAVAPWPAQDEALDVFQRLKPLGDLERYDFEDYRNTAVRVAGAEVAPAVYSRPGEAWILLGNTEQDPKTVRVTADSGKLRHALDAVKATVLSGGRSQALRPGDLAAGGAMVTVPGDDLVLIHLTGNTPRESVKSSRAKENR